MVGLVLCVVPVSEVEFVAVPAAIVAFLIVNFGWDDGQFVIAEDHDAIASWAASAAFALAQCQRERSDRGEDLTIRVSRCRAREGHFQTYIVGPRALVDHELLVFERFDLIDRSISAEAVVGRFLQAVSQAFLAALAEGPVSLSPGLDVEHRCVGGFAKLQVVAAHVAASIDAPDSVLDLSDDLDLGVACDREDDAVSIAVELVTPSEGASDRDGHGFAGGGCEGFVFDLEAEGLELFDVHPLHLALEDLGW